MRLKMNCAVQAKRRAQSGFSMIEMLMTAFILAIGILGLSMLQIMSLKASRGSRSLTTAVQVGEGVMDQIEMEGRLSWLNSTDTQLKQASITPIAVLQYVNHALPVTNYFDINGVATASAADPKTFYTVVTDYPGTPATANHIAVPPPADSGPMMMDDYSVTVNFADAVDPATQVPIPRTVNITRRILHG